MNTADLRFAIRTLRQRPGFTLLVVVTLALGIGATTVVLDLVNLFHWRQLPVERPRELVEIYTASRQSFAGAYGPTSWPDYVDYRDRALSIADLAALEHWWLPLDQTGEDVEAWAVTGNFFAVLGVQPALGRLLSVADDQSGGPSVAVLSHAHWRQLGGDPAVVGNRVRLGGMTLEVVGVAPENFHGTQAGSRPVAYFPARLGHEVLEPASEVPTDRDHQAWNMIGRLNPGTRHEQAQAEFTLLAEALNSEFPIANFERRVTLTRATLGHAVDRMRIAPTLRLFAASVTLLVLIVCANVAHLLLSRAASRRREMGIRQSLGAGRGRLVRQLLTESLLLATLGGLGGLFLAFWGRGLLGMYFGPEIVQDMKFDHRVLGLTLLVSLGVTLLCGLAPALVTSRVNLVTALKNVVGDGAGRRRWTAGPLLAVAQVALSLVLLVACGLLVGNLWHFRTAHLGFDANNLLMTRVDLSRDEYTPEKARRLFHQLRERAEAIPGVRSAGLPLLMPPLFLDVTTKLRLPEDPETVHASRVNYADAAFFSTLGLPLFQGRLFEGGDRESGHGVVVINRKLAEKLWPGEPAIGRRIQVDRVRPGDPGEEYEVVGVVGSVSQFSGSRVLEPVVYFSWDQRYRPSLFVVLRTEGGDPEGIFAALRAALHQLDPGLSLGDPRTHDAYRWQALVEQRLQTQTMALFGAAGFFLALLGIFGVMSHAVSRQVREIGIRMAVGARQVDVLRWILARGLALVLAGLALGLLSSFWVLQVLRGWISGLTDLDPKIVAMAAVLLLLTSLGAIFLPARRASRIDPLAALHDE